jgi:hypothetical protein
MGVFQLYVQDEDYVAKDDRLIWSAILPPGSGANSVLGRAGGVRQAGDFSFAWTGTRVATIGTGLVAIAWGSRHYMLCNDTPLVLPAFTQGGANPRIDSVIARVYDTEAGGAAHAAEIAILPGTAAATPAAPTLPAGSIRLWNVRFEANQTTNGAQTDQRVYTTAAVTRSPINQAGWSLNMGTNNPPSSAFSDWRSMTNVSLAEGPWLIIVKANMDMAISANVVWRIQIILDPGQVVQDTIDAAGIATMQRVPWLLTAYLNVVGTQTMHVRLSRSGSTAGTQLVSNGRLVGIPL